MVIHLTRSSSSFGKTGVVIINIAVVQDGSEWFLMSPIIFIKFSKNTSAVSTVNIRASWKAFDAVHALPIDRHNAATL